MKNKILFIYIMTNEGLCLPIFEFLGILIRYHRYVPFEDFEHHDCMIVLLHCSPKDYYRDCILCYYVAVK